MSWRRGVKGLRHVSSAARGSSRATTGLETETKDELGSGTLAVNVNQFPIGHL